MLQSLNADKKVGPIFPICIALLILALAYFLTIQFLLFLGFPDGYMSELDHAEAPLIETFNKISFVASLWFAYLAFAARKNNINKRFLLSCIVYAVVMLAAFLLDLYFRSYMMDSAGG